MRLLSISAIGQGFLCTGGGRSLGRIGVGEEVLLMFGGFSEVFGTENAK